MSCDQWIIVKAQVGSAAMAHGLGWHNNGCLILVALECASTKRNNGLLYPCDEAHVKGDLRPLLMLGPKLHPLIHALDGLSGEIPIIPSWV